MSTDYTPHRTGLALLGVTIAAGLVLATGLAGATFERVRRAGDRITVKGYAEEHVVSDTGVWRGNLTARAADLKSAYAKLDADATRVRAFLAERTAGEAQVEAGSVNMNVQYEFDAQGKATGRVASYQLDESFEITSSDVELVTRVAREASQLIAEGIEIESWPPQYFYADLNAVKVRLLGAATRDAGARAGEFAGNSGVTVGPLKSATQGVFQITQINSTDTADYGSYDTSTVDKAVKAVVTVEYAVEPL